MNAYKCDRCGKFYDKFDDKKRVTIKGFVPMFFKFGNSDTQTIWKDLCPDCMNELVFWFYTIRKAQGQDIPIEDDTPTDTPTKEEN